MRWPETLITSSTRPGDPVIAVGIAPAAVAGEVIALVLLEIGLLNRW
jgi:hypothetical protein